MPVFYYHLNDKNGIKARLLSDCLESDVVLYDVEDYFKRHELLDTIDDTRILLYLGLFYQQTASPQQKAMDFLKAAGVSRPLLVSAQRYLSYALAVVMVVLLSVEVKQVVQYVHLKQTLATLDVNAAGYANPLKSDKHRGQVALRVNNNTLSKAGLYDWLRPLAHTITRDVWLNSIQIDYDKGDFKLSGQSLSFHYLLAFVNALKKDKLYSQAKMALLEHALTNTIADDVLDDESHNDTDREKAEEPPGYKPLVKDWLIAKANGKLALQNESSQQEGQE